MHLLISAFYALFLKSFIQTSGGICNEKSDTGLHLRTYLINLSWVCTCRNVFIITNISQGMCGASADTASPDFKSYWRYWPLWFTDTDLGTACQDICDKWRHSTADLTAWKYHFRCWSRRRDVRVILFLTVYIAKICSVPASWSHFPPDSFLWWLYESVTVVKTRTKAWF